VVDDNDESSSREERSGPAVVAPSTRVNVAFPLSSIHIQEPSEDLAELADVVEELGLIVEKQAPGRESERLVKRARAVAARLRFSKP